MESKCIKIIFIIFLGIIIIGCSSVKELKIPENYKQKLPKQAKLNVPMILQDDWYSCATTSLAMVMSYYNNKIYNKNDVWKKSGSSIEDVTRKCGNDMNGLMRASEVFGFTKYEFIDNLKIDELKYLITQNIPVVVNIRNFFKASSHAVVVVGYDEQGFFINDPANYLTDVTYHIDYMTFKNHWWANLCSPLRGRHYNSAFILYKK